MLKTKLISVLRTFSEKEMKQFVKWMDAELFNTNKNLSALTRLLAAAHPAFEPETITKEYLSEKLFPGEAYNYPRMRNLSSDLQKQAEDFMIWWSVSNKQQAKDFFLLEELNTRRLDSLFESRLKEARKRPDEKNVTMISRALSGFLIDQEEYRYQYNLHFGQVYKVYENYDSKKIFHSITNLFLSNLLYYRHIQLDNNRIYGKKDNSQEKLDAIAEELYKETGQDNVLVAVYFDIIKLLRTGSTKYYFKIKKEVQGKKFDTLLASDQQSINTVLVNFCLLRHLSGEPEFSKELLALSEFALQKRLCFRDDFISHIFFFNFTYYNAIMDKVDAGRAFMRKYSNDLQAHLKESTLHYCNAYLLFVEKKYSEALLELNLVTYDTPQRFIGIKNLLMKIYYEKEDTEPVYFVIDSIRHKLASETFYSDYYVVAEKHFISYYSQLLKLKNSSKASDQAKIKALRRKLAEPAFVFHREWLQERLKELSK